MTRNALAVRNNEACDTDKSRQAVVLYSPFCIIKSTGRGNNVVGHFHTRARKWIIRQTLACVQSPPRPPPQTPLSVFFFCSEGRGRLYTGYLERIIHLQTVRQNWRIKSDRLFRSKLKPFHFQIKTYYLSGANYQTDNPSHMNDLFLL